MAQYLAPGVYVEEVSSGSAPIAGVSTSVAGFIGIVLDDVEMPPKPDQSGNYEVAAPNDPQLITSWEGFKSKFGDGIQKENKILAHAVYGFFNNGGTRCWVVRSDQSQLNTGNVRDALEKFEAIDEITIVAVPGAVESTLQKEVISHCEKMGDRFAILDGKKEPQVLTADAINEAGTSDYAALYFPWIQVYDPVKAKDKAEKVKKAKEAKEAKAKTEGAQDAQEAAQKAQEAAQEAEKAGENDDIPPSGHLAGIYARSDEQRGVHKAPANEVIRGAVGVERRLSKADQAGLNPDGINVIRQFNGNVTVWGARTLGGDKNLEWKYINVRRLFLFLRESISEGTQWAVFEPNGPDLWGKIRRNITAFLTNVWRDGALFGATPEQAFFVRCDETTNPPEVRDLGQVVTEIGVAVIKPAEFVIFRISQWAGAGG